VAVFALTTATVLVGTAWTGTAPGGTAAASGTISSSTDISAMLVSVELSLEAEDLESTAFGGAWRTRISGLLTGNVALEANQDYAASQFDALFGLGGTLGIGSTSTLYMDIKATSSARSATNPSYVLRFLNLGGKPMGGGVGQLARTGTWTFPTTGLVQRLTS
jgi:hypothetical protein